MNIGGGRLRTVADIARQDLEQTMATEIAKARQSARPISRLALTKLLQSEYSLHVHDAERIVDEYCEEKEPGVPTYLSAEFGVPYLKILGIAQLVVAVAFYVFPIIFPRADLTFWPAMVLGTVFGGLGVFCLYRTMKPAEAPKMSRFSGDMPRTAMNAEQPEAVVTGSSQPRS